MERVVSWKKMLLLTGLSIFLMFFVVACGDDTQTGTKFKDEQYGYYGIPVNNEDPTTFLFGVTHYTADPSNTSHLYLVSTANGATTRIGDIGFKVNGIAYNSITKKLYGITEGAGSQLIDINMLTGQGTLVATITGPATSAAINTGWNNTYITAIGKDGSDYYAQAFIANTTAITKFGVVIQERTPQGELRLAIAADNGGVPNYAAPLYQGALIDPTNIGAWYYESGINVPLTIGQKYYILYDGYDIPGTTGWDGIGVASFSAITGQGIQWSNSGGVGPWNTMAYPLAIYVEGAPTYSNPAFNSKGELFAYNTDNTLCTINVTTGVATSRPGNGIFGVNYGLAFDKSDTLYLVNGTGGNIYTLDQTTGASTFVRAINNLPSQMAHRGAFHPVTGRYWGLDTTDYYTPTRNLLVTDVGAGTLKQTIRTRGSLHALAFVRL